MIVFCFILLDVWCSSGGLVHEVLLPDLEQVGDCYDKALVTDFSLGTVGDVEILW